MKLTDSKASTLDQQDSLASKRSEFILPEDIVYLDGNSLGPLTHKAKNRADEVISLQWGQDLITSWNKHHWIDLPSVAGAKIARLIGAEHDEVICCDSTSINLFKVLSHCLAMNSPRNKIISQNDNFPTDLYMAEGLSMLLGAQSCQLVTVPEQDILNALDTDTAVLFLTQVNFRTGRIHDIKMLTERAHELGILVVWDLAHSAGVIPLELTNWGVDFAIGCGYKYLNGGPGAPAFVYANTVHHEQLKQPLTGWMGHANPFAFTEHYEPSPDMKQFLVGTPGIISMSVMDAALDIFADIEVAAIRDKSLALTDYFMQRLADSHVCSELVSLSPIAHAERGSQLSYSHPHAYAICQALIAMGVIADFRAPDILRLGFSPLYLSFSDLDRALEALESVMRDKSYLDEQYQQRNAVT